VAKASAAPVIFMVQADRPSVHRVPGKKAATGCLLMMLALAALFLACVGI
jgi:hypothetical protein